MREGLVISDLHLLSGRSQANSLLASIREDLAASDLLVLNGDTFDFNWSHHSSETESIDAAIQWLEKLAADFHGREIHYLLGNHDCLENFLPRLEILSLRSPHFQWHDSRLKLDRTLFLHGDCANRKMDGPTLDRLRKNWSREKTRNQFHSALYKIVDNTGMSRRFQQLYFPQPRTVKRVAHHLDHVLPNWREEIDDVYFGHTHQPFRDHEHEGVRFHNTGSGILDLGFQPLSFQVPSKAA